MVLIDRDVNDGPIPGLSVNDKDPKDLKLSCNWQKLLYYFYAEEHLYHAITARTREKRKSLLADLRVKADRGKMSISDMNKKVLEMLQNDSHTARKMARRARIQRQFMENNGPEWDFCRDDGNLAVEQRRLYFIEKMRRRASLDDENDDGIDTVDHGQWRGRRRRTR
jgi:hypothetical protein